MQRAIPPVSRNSHSKISGVIIGEFLRTVGVIWWCKFAKLVERILSDSNALYNKTLIGEN